MKTKEATEENFSEITESEITRLGGGEGFAFDAGRFLRYMGIYIANGTGVAGNVAAMSDALANYLLNTE